MRCDHLLLLYAELSHASNKCAQKSLGGAKSGLDDCTLDRTDRRPQT